jgi:hypothetical protein
MQFVRRDPPLLSKKRLQYIIAIFISSICFHLLFAVNELVGKDFAILLWGLIKEGNPLLRISQKNRISLARFEKKTLRKGCPQSPHPCRSREGR